MTARCFQCGHDNEEAAFCSACGSPLVLTDYISKTVKEQLATLITNRDVIEAESAHKIFEKVTGWFKLFAVVIAVAVAILDLAVYGNSLTGVQASIRQKKT